VALRVLPAPLNHDVGEALMSLRIRLTASVAVLSALTGPAHAQNQQQAQAAQVTGLEEIVVTAQRRETRLQDTPIAITAISELQIERQQITEAMDLGRVVPNLIATNNVTLGASNTYFLRGIGSTESLATFDPPVGTYVDDIFVARQNANNLELVDVERIEVLRGPQGTLFGRNTSGGAISIITRKPNEEFGARGEVSYGRYDEFTAKGSVNIPFSDKVFALVSGYYVTDDGWQTSVRTGEKFNFIDAHGFRGALRFQPTDNVTWDVSGDWQTQDHQNLASIVDPAREATNVKAGKSGPWVLGSGTLNDVYMRNCKTGAGPLQWVRNGCSANEMTGYNLYSNLAFEMGDDLTVNVITGYRNLDHDFVSPLFASLRAGFELPLANDGNHNQFSNEIKATGSLMDGGLRYTTGVFYMTEDNLSRYETSLAAPPANVFLVLDDTQLENDTRSIAWYGQGEYDIDKFTLIAGVRWTDERKVLKQFIHGGANGNFTLADITRRGIPDAKSAVLWTPKFVAQYNATEDIMVYASATKGFKSGGWNGRASTAESMTRFNEERVWSYELGTRMEFNNRVRANLTAFSATYSDLQLPALLRTPALGEAPIFVTGNAGKSRVRGVEFDGNAIITDGLTGTLSFGIMKGKYLQLGAGVTAGGFTLDDETDRTPHFTSNLGLTYEFPRDIANGSVAVTADWQHVSEFEGNGSNDPANHNNGYDTVNGSINWDSEDEHWGVQLGCKNCLDERVIGTHFLNARFIADPMRWSIKLKYKY